MLKLHPLGSEKRLSYSFLIAVVAVIALLPVEIMAQTSASPVDVNEFQVFGHNVKIEPEDDVFTTILVDGKEMYSGRVLGVETATVGGVGVIIGYSNERMSCEALTFIIALPEGRPPRNDGVVDPCDVKAKMTISERDIVFEIPALPGKLGKNWRWTPKKGLILEAKTNYRATKTKGWAALEAKKLQRPGEILEYKDLERVLRRTTEGGWGKVSPALSGPGSMGYANGNLAVGTSCEPHFCADRQVLIVADITRRHLYVGLWLASKKNIILYPSNKGAWSREAYKALTEWSQGQ